MDKGYGNFCKECLSFKDVPTDFKYGSRCDKCEGTIDCPPTKWIFDLHVAQSNGIDQDNVMKKAMHSCISHHTRMRDYAMTLPPDNDTDETLMYRSIGENWYAAFCSLCIINQDDACMQCPITGYAERPSELDEEDGQVDCGCATPGHPWLRLQKSEKWKDFIDNANKMIAFLYRKLDEMEAEDYEHGTKNSI
jgi:hypothetical protein